MGTSALRRMQYGVESVHGTAEAATRMLPVAVPPIRPDRQPTYPRENAGVLADAVRSYVSGRLVKDSIRFDTAYYQLLPMLFSCSLKGGVTPVEQTTDQDDYLWNHPPVLDGSASNEQDSITLERGDDTFMVESEYVMFDSLRLIGEISQEGRDSSMQIEASYFGRQNTVTAFTDDLTPMALTPINAKLARFYLDGTWAGVGSTEKTLTLRGWNIEIMSGLHPKFHGSANDYFDNHGEGAMAFLAAFTFEGNANMSAIYTAMLASSLQVARLKIEGPQIGTGAKQTMQLDLGGSWSEVVPLSAESNGNDLWAAILHGYWDPTGKKMIEAQAITNMAAM